MDGMAPFMPHGMCFLWRPDVLALHVVSDALIALCYFCIPVVLLTFVRRRPALRRFGWFFSSFIAACGITHAMDVWTIWHADYWVSGACKAVAAVASLGTVGALLPLMPYARALRRFGELDRLNQELESQYRLIVETSNDGIWLTDSAGRATFVNSRVTELLRFSSAEILGRPLADFLAATHSPATAPFTPAPASGPPAAQEWCFRRKDGTRVWTEASVKAIVGSDGIPAGSIAMITDSTERHAARAALADSERRYRLLAEAMPHPVFVTDAAGRPNYHNRAWYESTGQTVEQSADADGWRSVVHPEDVAAAVADWAHALRSGEPLDGEFRMRRASDGRYRWFVSRATPVRDTDGTIAGWIGSMADIHDYKLASETRSVLDRLGHITTIRNADGAMEYASPSWAAFIGASESEHVTRRGRDFVHPDDLPIVEELDRASGDAVAQVVQSQVRLRGADGIYHWFLTRMVALPAKPGAPLRRLTTLTDIDELKAAQAAVSYSEMRYRALTDAMPQIVWTIDAEATIEYVNERWSIYSGLPSADATPCQATRFAHPDDVSTLAACFAALPTVESSEVETRLRRHDGAYRWHILRAVPLTDPNGSAPKWIVTATDIEARKFAEAALAQKAAELTHRAHHDPLTNLPNRTRLIERLRYLLDEAKREGTGVAVLYLDLDHFKTINDTLGHNAGDALLVQTAARIDSVLRNDDVVSRFGGDEFVLACSSADAEDAARIADRVATAVHAPLELGGKRVVVSSSIGIALFPDDGDDASELIARADAAMYDAKKNGRNAWALYTSQAHRTQTHRHEFPGPEIATES